MNYQQTVKYLYEQLPMFQREGQAAYKANLDNTIALDNYFAQPHTAYPCIHVAGTNGKGSSSHMIAAILQESGYRVGLYTSPHLLDFRERIRVNGQLISKDYVVDFVERYQSFFEPLKASFFELTVAMAFLYFKDMQVDVAIIETGLGGRLDSTNVLTPILSVITNIGLDHTTLLGDTLEQIAHEKAGIIKNKVPVVLGKMQASILQVFDEKAQQEEAPIIRSSSVMLGKFEHHYTWVLGEDSYEINLSLHGDYQYENLRLVLACLPILQKHFQIDQAMVIKALGQVQALTGLAGRWQVIQEAPYTVCDTGHNVDGIRAVVNQLLACAYQHLHLVIGIVKDKDCSGMLALLPKEANYYFTRASIPRSLPERDLQQQAESLGLNGACYPSVAQAYQAAKEQASVHDLIFIGGSTFVVADFLEEIELNSSITNTSPL